MSKKAEWRAVEIGLFRIIPLNSRACLDIAVCDEHGAIAQLGERLHGMQEVSGSIPLSSTSRPELSEH